MVLFSIATGLSIVNLLLIFLIPNFKQEKGYQRSLLNYFPPITRWSYPDYGKKLFDKTIFMIGDSYVEGMGDAYLQNKYNYSLGHYLKNKLNYNLELVANSGSFINLQLLLLEKNLNNNFNRLINENKETHILAFFYEGNDLDNQVSNPDLQNDFSLKRKIFLNKNFPIYYFFRAFLRLNIKPLFNKLGLKEKISNNKLSGINNVCINSECRQFPPLQSASPELSKNLLNQSIESTINGLKNFKEKYKSQILLVYIPSPGTIYSPEEFYAQTYITSEKYIVVKGSKNIERSKYIREKLKYGLLKYKIDLIDSTELFMQLGSKKFLHGVIDPKHFNKEAYEELASFIIRKKNYLMKE